MNFRKVLIKVTGILAGLLVLVLIGLTAYQNHLMKRAAMEGATGNETAGETVVSSTESDMPGGEAADAAEKELQAERESREALKRRRIESQKKILEDPAIRESIRSGLDAQYKPLFELLALSPEQQEKLTAILTNSAVSYIELNPEILAAATDEEKAMLQQRYDYLREETQLRAEVLLGHEAFKRYQAYEDRSLMRSVVSGFSESLTPDDRLTDDQKYELIEIMYGEAQNVYEDIGYDPTSRLEFPSDMDTETISSRMEITDRIFSNSADNSWGILSESQLKAYREYLRNYSEKMEMSLFMMGQEYGQ